MKSRLIVAAALLVFVSLASPARAAGGLYLGAGAGQATLKDDTSGGTFDLDHTAYKGFVGYRFNALPIIDLAAEGAYTDFGKPSQTVGGQTVQFKLHSASLSGLLIFPLGPLDLYAKGGVHSWKAETTIGGASASRSGSDPLYGAGVGFYLWKIGIRAEYERFQVKDIDRVDLLSLQALFQF